MKHAQHRETGERVGNGSEANKPSEPRFFSIGYIARPHGVRGEMWVKVDRHAGLPPLDGVTHVYLGAVRSGWVLQSFRFHLGGLLLMLEGCDNRDAAETMRGQEVVIPMLEQQVLETHEYYVDDLLGLSVCDEQGEYLGELMQVLPTGANDVYRVVNGEEELLLPAITTVIRSVDIGNGEVVVRLLPGL